MCFLTSLRALALEGNDLNHWINDLRSGLEQVKRKLQPLLLAQDHSWCNLTAPPRTAVRLETLKVPCQAATPLTP